MIEAKLDIDGQTLHLTIEQYKRIIDALRFYSKFLDSELNVAHSLAFKGAEVAAVESIADELLKMNEINAQFNTLSTKLVNAQASGETKPKEKQGGDDKK